MAFRIQDSVVRGEIDNRIKGVVRGRIWVHGRAEPIVIELRGNAHPDLAGCLLMFTNPLPTTPYPNLDTLAAEQTGSIGDLTASRKVWVPAVPLDEFLDWPEEKGQPRERMANCLYLEWFSQANGRVVIESTDYKLAISIPEWRLTPAEGTQRAQDAEAGWSGFVSQLNEALEKQQRGQKNPELDWDEHDYEKFMQECDARTDKYLELQEKYGDSDEAEAEIAKAMGWEGEGDDGGDGDDNSLAVEEMDRIMEEALNEPEPEPDPLTEGRDWIRTEDGDLRHPLQYRCFESALSFRDACAVLGFKKSDDEDLHQFIFEFQTASVKLAGALSGLAHGRDLRDALFTVACLKRALDHVHKSQAGLEAVASKKLLPEKLTADAQRELFEIREGILRLMDEFRGRK